MIKIIITITITMIRLPRLLDITRQGIPFNQKLATYTSNNDENNNISNNNKNNDKKDNGNLSYKFNSNYNCKPL